MKTIDRIGTPINQPALDSNNVNSKGSEIVKTYSIHIFLTFCLIAFFVGIAILVLTHINLINFIHFEIDIL